MQAVEMPGNEAERLEALRSYAILDSGQEHDYDDLTRLAAFVCDTPMAAISLLDSERQWLKSRVGLEITETPREHSFCTHLVLEPDQLLVVPDASLDPRFAESPLVAGGPRIRFYAGAPLVTADGYVLGALCVMDREPRELSPERLGALKSLSHQVMVQLELRRSAAELARTTEQAKADEWQMADYKRQLEAANAELEEQATTDGLTGLMNRRAFDHAFLQELARAERTETPLSLALVDVDRFKLYNNVYGTAGGDKALRTIAGLLTEHTRPYDVVARFDGQQFAVLLFNTGEDAAVLVGERLRRAVEAAPWKQYPITASVGATTADGKADPVLIIDEAQEALRHAKTGGRNMVRHISRYR